MQLFYSVFSQAGWVVRSCRLLAAQAHSQSSHPPFICMPSLFNQRKRPLFSIHPSIMAISASAAPGISSFSYFMLHTRDSTVPSIIIAPFMCPAGWTVCACMLSLALIHIALQWRGLKDWDRSQLAQTWRSSGTIAKPGHAEEVNAVWIRVFSAPLCLCLSICLEHTDCDRMELRLKGWFSPNICSTVAWWRYLSNKFCLFFKSLS